MPLLALPANCQAMVASIVPASPAGDASTMAIGTFSMTWKWRRPARRARGAGCEMLVSSDSWRARAVPGPTARKTLRRMSRQLAMRPSGQTVPGEMARRAECPEPEHGSGAGYFRTADSRQQDQGAPKQEERKEQGRFPILVQIDG